METEAKQRRKDTATYPHFYFVQSNLRHFVASLTECAREAYTSNQSLHFPFANEGLPVLEME
jgi:hypothetical protein